MTSAARTDPRVRTIMDDFDTPTIRSGILHLIAKQQTGMRLDPTEEDALSWSIAELMRREPSFLASMVEATQTAA